MGSCFWSFVSRFSHSASRPQGLHRGDLGPDPIPLSGRTAPRGTGGQGVLVCRLLWLLRMRLPRAGLVWTRPLCPHRSFVWTQLLRCEPGRRSVGAGHLQPHWQCVGTPGSPHARHRLAVQLLCICCNSLFLPFASEGPCGVSERRAESRARVPAARSARRRRCCLTIELMVHMDEPAPSDGRFPLDPGWS